MEVEVKVMNCALRSIASDYAGGGLVMGLAQAKRSQKLDHDEWILTTMGSSIDLW